MNNKMTRVLLLIALVLPFAACKKQEAPVEAAKAPVAISCRATVRANSRSSPRRT